MDPNQPTAPAERGRNFEGSLVMVNSILRLTIGSIYIAKDAVAIVLEQRFFAFLREEIDSAERGFFCSVELFVALEHPSKLARTLCLFYRVTESFVRFRRF